MSTAQWFSLGHEMMSLLLYPLAQPVFCAIEVAFVTFLLWYIVHRHTRPAAEVKLSREEEDQLITDWEPEPLVPKTDPGHYALNPRVVSSVHGKYITVDGRRCLNLATHNYLGLAENSQCLQAAIDAVKTYGVGSCGPRGFFGTVDVHLALEEEIARFMGTEEAILYSYGYAAISSAIPAYCKVNDVIFVDEGVSYPIQQGLAASRSTIRFFRHNDPTDLARLLEEQHREDLANPKKARTFSRFLILEGLYLNYGDLCLLQEMVELKRKYKLRLFIDDTCGFGVLGETGRGIVEHTGVSLEDIDLISASLEYSCAAYGGFCTGTHYIVDHQRLSGLGYCFSASLPPLQAAYALRSIQLFKEEPEMITTLRERCQQMDFLLKKDQSVFVVEGDEISPVKHLRFRESIEEVLKKNGLKANSMTPGQLETLRLEKVVASAQEVGLALTVARYLERAEHYLPPPTIRLTLSAALTHKDLEHSSAIIAQAFATIHKQFTSEHF